MGASGHNAGSTCFAANLQGMYHTFQEPSASGLQTIHLALKGYWNKQHFLEISASREGSLLNITFSIMIIHTWARLGLPSISILRGIGVEIGHFWNIILHCG